MPKKVSNQRGTLRKKESNMPATCKFQNTKTRKSCRKEKKSCRKEKEIQKNTRRTTPILENRNKSLRATPIMKKERTMRFLPSASESYQSSVTSSIPESSMRHSYQSSVISSIPESSSSDTDFMKESIRHSEIMIPQISSENEMEIFEYLTKVCADSGECIAVGKEIDKIRSFFNGFTDFTYAVQGEIERIGASSLNGFVYKIEYRRLGYPVFAVLKSANVIKMKNGDIIYADNLVYEYMVGQYINKLCRRFPCFLETYGLFYYKSEREWAKMKNDKLIKPLASVLDLETNEGYRVDLPKACLSGKHAAVLIQHINTGVSFYKILSQNALNANFLNYELPLLLFQIYFPLAALSISQSYTHNDLHLDNVLIYELPENKCIHFVYSFNESELVYFRSKYIVKIIDYGRNYFYDNHENVSTTRIYNHLCTIRECDPECGNKKGFSFLRQPFSKSCDLKLFQFVKDIIAEVITKFKVPLEIELISLFEKLEYDKNVEGNHSYPIKIQTVQDICLSLRDYIIQSDISEKNHDNYDGYIYAGMSRVYVFRDMIYEPPVDEDL